jgi:hypothetical protein
VTGPRLKAILMRRYGDRWARGAAEELGVHRCTISQWCKMIAVPDDIADEVEKWK